MGRNRLESDEKKISIRLTVKKKYIDKLKQQNVNISQLFEQFVEEFLKK